MNPQNRINIPLGTARLDAPDSTLYNSDADWVKPQIRISPATSCGNGNPTCKVNVNDSDHSYFLMWKDTPQQNRNYAWQNFMTGNQLLFMDPYVLYYPRGAGTSVFRLPMQSAARRTHDGTTLGRTLDTF